MTDAELHQRLLHLTHLLDQLGEPLWWMKLDLKRFFGDGRVVALGRFAHAYLWLLARMWERGGYVPANDRVIAHLLGIDVAAYTRTYKHRLEPLLVRLPDAHFGSIFTQKTCVAIMVEQAEIRLANKAKTSQATAARRGKSQAKSKQRGHVTSIVTNAPNGDVATTVTVPVTDTVTITSKSREEERTLPIKKAESSFPPARQGLGASSGVPTAPVDDPAALAALHRKGAALTPPSPSLLNSPIVKGNGHGTAAQPDADAAGDRRDQEPLHEPERARRTDAPAVGLFGALEAAIRAAKPNDDD